MHLITQELYKKTDGLLYFSESNFPVKPFNIYVSHESEIPTFIASHVKVEKKFVKNVDAQVFFGRFELYLSYGGPDEIMNENARNFIDLYTFLKDHFRQIFVYRIEQPGKALVPLFIIAQYKNGYAGLQTIAVETG